MFLNNPKDCYKYWCEFPHHKLHSFRELNICMEPEVTSFEWCIKSGSQNPSRLLKILYIIFTILFANSRETVYV
jgi:hypothetical protein